MSQKVGITPTVHIGDSYYMYSDESKIDYYLQRKQEKKLQKATKEDIPVDETEATHEVEEEQEVQAQAAQAQQQAQAELEKQ